LNSNFSMIHNQTISHPSNNPHASCLAFTAPKIQTLPTSYRDQIHSQRVWTVIYLGQENICQPTSTMWFSLLSKIWWLIHQNYYFC
jgi:hypothetical protein